jgi:23S rRNA (guanosine2251-2'-O)-methyltransferase
VALVAAPEEISENDYFNRLDWTAPSLTLCAGGVQDPQNLGAICRSLAAFGHHHLWLPTKGTAPFTETTLNVSRGGLLSLCTTRLENLPAAISRFKDKGGHVIGADPEGAALKAQTLTGPTLLVMGAEHEGLGKLKQQCSEVFAIPLPGPVGSLNVSASAAVFLMLLGGK